MEQHSLTPSDIHYVVCTHGHSDHVGNNNLFLDARQHIVGRTISRGDHFYLHDFDTEDFNVTDDGSVSVRATSGHTAECISVIVKDTIQGTVVIAGDLFEKYEDIDDDSLWTEAGSADERVQRSNRSAVAEVADAIVPGHGPMFLVNDEIRKKLRDQC